MSDPLTVDTSKLSSRVSEATIASCWNGWSDCEQLSLRPRYFDSWAMGICCRMYNWLIGTPEMLNAYLSGSGDAAVTEREPEDSGRDNLGVQIGTS